MSDLKLPHGLEFAELYERAGLIKLDGAFVDFLAAADAALHNRLMAARRAPEDLPPKDELALLIELSRHVEDFLAALFGVSAEAASLRQAHQVLAPLFDCKRLFVQRQAAKAVKPDDVAALDGDTLLAQLAIAPPGSDLDGWELAFARRWAEWSKDEVANEAALKAALHYGAWALLHEAGRARHRAGMLFKTPHKLDINHLVPVEIEIIDGIRQMMLPKPMWRHRQGFALTDSGYDLRRTLDNAHYCIYCHNQGKDSCARGLTDRKTGAFAKSPFGVTLAGCPLEEKISEMNLVKAEGFSLGALAIICVDNPLCAATGHRICNDCMKSCIYQKQEPVDIPQIETRTLKDVLDLPWGFEIYSLLTRWNPLNLRRPLPRPDSGRSVLVVGMGPAGFNLSHHLMNDGHRVIGIDGLKIEPLAGALAGADALGKREEFAPIRDAAAIREDLGERSLAGFGGVAEYGITVRWDKNFLKIIRLLLQRRRQFALVGGVRFGGTVTVESAFAMGFDHIALCAGAGKPTYIAMPNGLARGVRQASDFLMALQLTGAAKKNSLANLQIRLPAVVIGGGLTAIDTATELLAYYVVQVEKFLSRYEILIAERGEAVVREGWSEEEGEIAGEFLTHARAIRAERNAAEREGRQPRIAQMLNQWGGVTIAYRRRLIDSPSYTLNHEEVHKAMEEGIRFAEGVSPLAIEIDRFGHTAALKVAVEQDGAKREAVLPARAILVAAGTQPNTVLAREDPEHAVVDGKFFQALDEQGAPATPERLAKPAELRVLTHLAEDGRAVSYWGDLHPSFAGNVVKAMGGTKQGYPVITRMLEKLPRSSVDGKALVGRVNDEWRARVHQVNRLTPTIVEVVVKAPTAAQAFEPGQFYRLQNFEALAPSGAGTALAMEGLALTGAWADRERGLLSTIVLEMGGSSDICAILKPGEPVILMGPTGTPTEIPTGETIVLVGGGLGNAVLFSIGAALRRAGCKVLYFAGYKRVIDRYKVAEIEAASDVVVWCCDEQPGFAPTRAGDKAVVANIVEAMRRYGANELGGQPIALADADRLIAIGSDGMMAAVGRARHFILKPFMKPGHVGIASINSPMQCMMKEICAQCLQRHVDPLTGEEKIVFSCFNQDQPIDAVDFANLRQRLGQNSTQEKLSRHWIDHALRQAGLRS